MFCYICISYGINQIYQRYFRPVVNISDLIHKYNKMISIFSWKQSRKNNRGITWISSPILLNKLQEIKLGWI